jgi:hypothetical protein
MRFAGEARRPKESPPAHAPETPYRFDDWPPLDVSPCRRSWSGILSRLATFADGPLVTFNAGQVSMFPAIRGNGEK